jgi:hypothetical protein
MVNYQNIEQSYNQNSSIGSISSIFIVESDVKHHITHLIFILITNSLKISEL